MFGISKNKSMFKITKKELDWMGKKLTLETGKMARQADGAVMATLGETSVLCTVVAKKEAKEDQGFFPLTVHYQEKMAAGGKIPGGFFKREGKPSENETLTSRLIDRPIRPLFPDNFKNEVQIICTVFNYDGENEADMVAMIGASAALAISGIPFMGPIAAAKVGYKEGSFILNPTKSEQVDSELELAVAGTKEGVLMVESEANELDEEIMLNAVTFGFDNFQPVIKVINDLKKEAGKKDWEIPETPKEFAELKKTFTDKFKKAITDAYKIKDKLERKEKIDEVKALAIESLGEETEENAMYHKLADEVFHSIEKETVRSAILNGEKRIDGRSTKDIRPIECEVGLLTRNHGSALFTRGETQALVSLTLGTGEDVQIIDELYGDYKENFMLHYNFPPYSVGETGRLGAPGRREIGHGKLAWRALHAMLPTKEEFPYSIRLISEITESNGSSSMATVCGSSLALMDAGVPLKKAVAGIAMGLIKEDKKFEVLSDIMGDEDHLGDMDFKVAGTKEGITSLQMDIKITSITKEIMKIALKQANDGRQHILKEMSKAIKEARKDMSAYAPRLEYISVPVDKIREVIGSGGSVIRDISETTNTKIEIEDDGKTLIASENKEDIDAAKKRILEIISDPEVGEIYEGPVKATHPFGAFVQFYGNKEGLVHISELKDERVAKTEDVVKVGDVVKVKLIGFDKGKFQLSMKRVNEKGNKKEKSSKDKKPNKSKDKRKK